MIVGGGIMAIGYACIHLGSAKTKLSTLHVKNFTQEQFLTVLDRNLTALEEILRYNIHYHIQMLRISSDIVPLATHPINTVPWLDIYRERFKSIGQLIHEHGMRVSMHPGQYTVLNSIHDEVVQKAKKDLLYHAQFLDALGCDSTHKMVLHIGGVYGNKKESMHRFVENFSTLNPSIKKRLIIENDDKSYTVEEVLAIAQIIHIPVVFDTLHHRLNPPEHNSLSLFEWIEICQKTWKPQDGKQKIHYSQTGTAYKNGAHSASIQAEQFLQFYQQLGDKDIDIMLEVKDKNLSAIKCNLLIMDHPPIQYLEAEWAKYKYFVLGNSVKTYQEIRTLLKNKEHPQVLTFYTLLEHACDTPSSKSSQVNTLQHLWGYFKKRATPQEKKKFLSLMTGYQEDKKKLSALKKYLYQLSYTYSISYLLDSLYFYIE